MEGQKQTLADDNHAWLDSELAKHRRLTPIVVSLIESILRSRNIEFLTVTGRPKVKSSATEKIRRKSYKDPKQQLTDLTGIRIITFFDSHVRQVCATVREVFDVDESNSLDQSEVLGSDKIGYRSVHFVCTLGAARASLLEYDSLTTLKFEIQVRTVLQHAWAELAHDRSYKFGQSLPSPIQRKLNLYAGMLEIVDEAFDQIAKHIDDYSDSLQFKNINGLLNESINSISIARFLDEVRKESGVPLQQEAGQEATQNALVQELSRFGLSVISDAYALITDDFVEAYKKAGIKEGNIGFLRSLMMWSDLDRYFRVNGKPFDYLEENDIAFFATKYGEQKVTELAKKYDLEIVD